MTAKYWYDLLNKHSLEVDKYEKLALIGCFILFIVYKLKLHIAGFIVYACNVEYNYLQYFVNNKVKFNVIYP